MDRRGEGGGVQVRGMGKGIGECVMKFIHTSSSLNKSRYSTKQSQDKWNGEGTVTEPPL